MNGRPQREPSVRKGLPSSSTPTTPTTSSTGEAATPNRPLTTASYRGPRLFARPERSSRFCSCRLHLRLSSLARGSEALCACESHQRLGKPRVTKSLKTSPALRSLSAVSGSSRFARLSLESGLCLPVEKRMGTLRGIRLAIAVALTALYLSGLIDRLVLAVASAVSLVLLLVSAIGVCPLYSLLGISTCPRTSRA